MKRFFLFLALPLLAQLGFATNIPGPDGEQPSSTTRGFENGHEWVDLGLPSGTLWATCNIKADSPEAYGVYFPWGVWGGASESIITINWSNYRFRTSGDKHDNVCFNKYNTDSNHGPVDNKTQLELCDDAAHVNWGGHWRIPTEEQWIELMEYCSAEFYTGRSDNDKKTLYKVTYTGPNGQRLVLPGNHYWSSSLCKENPIYAMDYYVMPRMEKHIISKLTRNYTIAIRPVTSRSDISGNDSGRELEDMGLAANGSGSGDELSPSTRGMENGHEWVDLGLPSGTKWATRNIGAYTTAENGHYFAWGETSPKNRLDHTWERYRFRASGDDNKNVCFIKYNTDKSHGPVDNRTQLELSDDAAHVNWGGKWRIPTEEQWVELMENCTKETSRAENGRSIITFTGPNGKSIVLPTTTDAPEDFYTDGHYWSSSLNKENPYAASAFYFVPFTERFRIVSTIRKANKSIRPVMQ